MSVSLNIPSTNAYSFFFFNRAQPLQNVLSISMDLRFKTPANFYICGKSQCGKLFLVRSMLLHRDERFNPVRTIKNCLLLR